ncbi:hypothetical protein BBBOND_0405560 [Babesia bigemina]|uniref:Uncharacterized protein n=1 Tax=Babesia bigemina TaxID=5866 RepID=A0A061DBI5_BABBI|nr:hypothetical protein BBBOND_0405560 [Babesia bigemina]CDR98071.1 hypothetical protein BBBOND_0405560 [Babesia bigemina]|eukprot:XP_012770257.1 hypothetical protein BBBOND_0405560 [Babesia bigemina]
MKRACDSPLPLSSQYARYPKLIAIISTDTVATQADIANDAVRSKPRYRVKAGRVIAITAGTVNINSVKRPSTLAERFSVADKLR